PFLVEDASETAPKKDTSKDDKSKGDKSDPKKADPAKDDAAKDEKQDKDAEKPPKPLEIDLDGFEARTIELPVDSGELSDLQGGNGKAFDWRNPRIGADEGASKKKSKTGGSQLAMFDMHAEKKEREEKTIVGGLRSYELAAKSEKLLVATTDNEY